MKKLLSLIFAIELILSACETAQTQVTPPAHTSTPTLTPTGTQTPIPPTATITPLPTIPTFTPTFDVSTIVTVTPAEKAECPTENLQKKFVFEKTTYDPNFSKKILDFLNSGGSRHSIVTVYQQAYQWADNSIIQEKDVTGDKIPELLFTESGLFSVYMCDHGQYKIKVPLTETYHFTYPIIVEIQDLNKDGLVEIILMNGDDRVRIVDVFEWGGNDFKVLNPAFNTMLGPSTVEALDTNSDGVIDLIFKQAIPIWSEYYEGLPWRQENRIFIWDGQQFSLSGIEMAFPEYRFQAIQDGDVAISQNYFSKALRLYQEAINNDELRSFSPEISQNLRVNVEAQSGPNPSSSPTPYLIEDPAEYPSLAAYAYYRIMLLHLVQGQEAEAASTYQTMQETFSTDPYAAPYINMATAFWQSYQSTQRMYAGCAAAIQYAVEHPEILIPLGSDYHGWQSHIYEPADVCPFR